MARSFKDAKEELDQLEEKLKTLKEEQLDITDRMDKLESSRRKLLKRCNDLLGKITNRNLRLHAVEPSYCHHKEGFVDIEHVKITNDDGVITCQYMKCPHHGCTWWGGVDWFERERAGLSHEDA